MPSEDSFELQGELISRKEDTSAKSWAEVYKKHLSSAKWRNTREDLFRLRGRKCESNARPEHSTKLEVHHLTYERFGRERFSDLKIVCELCHEYEDRRREESVQIRQETNRMDRAFETYMDKKVGPGWESCDCSADYMEFLQWLQDKHTEDYYSY